MDGSTAKAETNSDVNERRIDRKQSRNEWADVVAANVTTKKGKQVRTDEEILDRAKEIYDRDFMGFETSDLIVRLPFKLAKKFLKPEATEGDWNQEPRERDALLKEMADYMPFAWKKANGERGLSAGRSMSHYNAWVWLAGDDLGDLTDYEYYGKDNLVRICNHYGWDAKQWDDGVRHN